MMIGLKKILIALFLLALPVLIWNCSSGENQRDLIAQVGNRKIDWKLLRRSFELEPKWGKGLTEREAYENQLNFLISRELYALEAEAEGLDRDSSIAAYLKFLKEKEMIKELYRQEVANKIRISEEEYRKAYENSKKQVMFHYVLTPDSQRAQHYYQQLKSIPFDQLELEREDDSKGTTGLLKFGEMDPALEAFVFDMKPGELAPPVRIREGWMVVKFVNGVVEKFMSELDFAEKKSKIRKVLFDRKAGKVANRYIKALMSDKDLQLNPPVFYALSHEFSRRVKNKYSEQPLPVFVSNREIQETEISLKDLQDSVLITFKDGHFTVRDFLRYLSNMPSGLRPRVKMQQELKDAIGVAVRNHYLAQVAYQRGLDRHPRVQYEYGIQRDELLAKYWLKRQRDKLQVSPQEIQEFRKKEKFKKIQARFNKKWSDEEVQDLILDYKFARLKIELEQKLREKYAVKVDTALFLEKIPHPDRLIKDDPIRFVVRELFN